MFTFTRRQRRVTAFALLLLFAGALGLAGLCAVWCGPQHGQLRLMGQVARQAPKKAQHSCCAQAAATAAAKAKGTLGRPAPGKSAECCQHERASSWVSVPDAAMAKVLKLDVGPASLPPADLAWLPARFRGSWAVLAPVRLVPSRQLPPKIPDLRVFLRSLTV